MLSLTRRGVAPRGVATTVGSAWQGALLALCALLLAACEPRAQGHVLARAGYGPDAWSRQRLEQLGVGAYVDEQLQPETIPDPIYQGIRAASPVLGLTYRQIRSSYKGVNVRYALSQLRIQRAIYSRRQLEAALIDFWLDHFNVFAGDGSGIAVYDLPVYEHEVIAPRVLGRFEDLLVAVARSPAMLDYLDNDDNSVFGINENYARELMELHTLGVNGSYGERDIVEVARCLTGWTTDKDALVSPTGFLYRPDWHDDMAKTVLGTPIPPGGGMQDGLAVLRLLANHPDTATHISRKLARRFVAEKPPERLVAAMAQRWLATGGDLREVVREMLGSAEFLLAADSTPPKVKRPLVLMASLARALDATGVDLPQQIIGDLRLLGEELYLERSPAGYPDSSLHWTGNSALLARFEIFHGVARGWHGFAYLLTIKPVSHDMLVDAWIQRLFVDGVSSRTRAAALAYLDALPPSVIADPWRASREALFVLLSSPEFLIY